MKGRLKVIDRKRKHERRLKSLEDPTPRGERTGKRARRYYPRSDRVLYMDKRWPKIRKLVLAKQPGCNVCKIRLATQVDHIRPHKGDPALFFNLSNCQPICKGCHQEKTAAERRGEAFYEGGSPSN